IYTEMAMSAADRLIIPFSADGSSKRAVKSVLSLVYGIQRRVGQMQSEFFRNSVQFRMAKPLIYAYVGNRLTQMNNSSASAYKTVVTEIFNEVFSVWQNQPQLFCPHPTGNPAPTTQRGFNTK
ncbi:MAG: ParA family protein, partial [Alphaproteobacteria bacterium]